MSMIKRSQLPLRQLFLDLNTPRSLAHCSCCKVRTMCPGDTFTTDYILFARATNLFISFVCMLPNFASGCWHYRVVNSIDSRSCTLRFTCITIEKILHMFIFYYLTHTFLCMLCLLKSV